MPTCRVCGEMKPPEDFYNHVNFTKYKKHKVTWCRPCQKMWIDMKKHQEHIANTVASKRRFSVSFD